MKKRYNGKMGREIFLPVLSEVNHLFYLGVLTMILILGSGISSTTHAQQRTVSGTVTDADRNETLPGVNILVKNSNVGTVTDIDGAFSLNVPANGAVLVFSFVGFERQEVAVNNRQTFAINLVPEQSDLDEVVVIGYGTRKKTSVTSSISKLENQNLDQLPVGRLENVLAGRMAGVNVTNTSNRPGDAPDIRVRGLGSISAGNDPLVVIDGFPGGSLGQLNMNDVESIEVLKDASSTAIYGSRGAGGVILVTTKRGSSQKPELKINSYFGMSNAIVHDDWLTGDEWHSYLTKYQNREFAWAGGDTSIPIWGDPRRPLTYQVNPLTKELPQTIWQDEVIKAATIQNHNISLSGGTENTKYYLSGTYMDEEGVLKTSGYKKYSFRANVDVKINEMISLGMELSPSYSKTRYAGSNMVSLVKYPPFVSPDYIDGKYPRTYDYIPTGHSGQASPYVYLYGTENNSNVFTNIGRAFINLDLMDGLSFKTSVGTNISFVNNDYWSGGIGDTRVNTNGNVSDSRSINLVNENVLNYTKTFNEVHNVGGLLGASYQNSTSRSLAMYAIPNSFNNDKVKTLNNAIINPANTTQSKSEWGLVSYFARVNYAYNDKYLLEGSFRRDGSSRFGPENKWGNFPSLSAAWRLSEEEFIKNIPNISDFKLRASYGVTGNFNIGNFQYLGSVGSVSYSPNNLLVNGIVQNSMANPRLSWEKTKGYDFGFEISFFQNRFSLNVDYYDNLTTGMLYNVNTPAITGFSSIINNVGEVRNSGLDVEIDTRNLVGEFKWNSSFNLSMNKNEVTDLGEVDERINTYWSMDFLLREGEPMFSYYGYQSIGVFQNEEQISQTPSLAGTKPGNPIFEDTNKDGKIDPEDKVVLGSFQPKMLLGFSNEFYWKQFDLSVFMQASLGAKMFNAENQYYEGNTLGAMRRSLVEDQWWSEEEPGNGTNPAAALSQLFGYNTNNDFYLEDASYLNVRSINLGYTFPNFSAGAGIKSLRLYASVNNLLVITNKNNHAYNPEGTTRGEVSGISSTPGVNLGSEPLNRTFVLGLNIGF
ncbi:TonB-dependent receptor [uncultured Cyclobacterium sp.]|uniref:SusC/RagA family TonB-linked outer membrane protein n=1 Tax=uncultured Cyclobacterium sp. TaxID=453820 RepID=UPI0030EB430F